MIIGIDVSQIVYKTGVSRYTKELVKALLKSDKKNLYKLFAGTLRQREEIENFFNELTARNYKFKSYIKLLPPQVADFLWNELHTFSVENFIGKIDVFHSSNWSQPPSRAYKVTTVHDLVPVLYPQYLPEKIVRNFHKNLKIIEKECDQIIAVSQATKADLINQSKSLTNKIEVIYSGVDSKFRPINDDKVIARVKEKYGIKGKYVLTVGTFEPRKNLKKVISAFNKLGRKDVTLVLAGKYGWGDKELPLSGCVLAAGFIKDDDLPALYSGALGFVFASLYEGFGLPVLEALACGCPVITSNVSSLPEVTGEAALKVDPYNEEDIMYACRRLIEDENLRKKLSAAGLKQAKKFTWEESARKTLQVYNKSQLT
ncbi:MAG: glycosyltransferase family 4 protein [Patescibacteria group bacterium]|jgi:glycosyltransferase involved in cell wall biosynthesis